MIYSTRLKNLREERVLAQKDLAKVLGISNSGYERYENEHDIFPLKHLVTICNYLNVSLDYLFSFKDINAFDSPFDLDNLLVGERLKAFRKDNKLTQVKLASILNIGNGTLADYERGRYLISTHALFDLCKRYGVSADYLLGKVDMPK